MKNFIGIDVACKTFVASIYQNHHELKISTSIDFSNDNIGYRNFINWLTKANATVEDSVICMENTGCYHEKIAYFLVSKNFKVSIEQPLKVKRAFPVVGHKTDSLDSKHIAEYAFRFYDQLNFWSPSSQILEKIKHLLSTRDLLVKQKTALKNANKSYSFHAVQVKLIIQTFEKNIQNLEKQIKTIDQEIQNLINQDPTLKNDSQKLNSITGFGNLLSTHFLLLIKSSDKELNYKSLAAYIGICPYKFESGSSVNKRPRIRHFGSSKTKSLLHMAAMSVAQHDKKYKEYYLRKQNEGKPKMLALNNIANKLIKVALAVLRDNNFYYNKEHFSVNPMYV